MTLDFLQFFYHEIPTKYRNKEKELDDAEELRQKDVAIYKQQIKFLLHEHQTTLAESRVPIPKEANLHFLRKEIFLS